MAIFKGFLLFFKVKLPVRSGTDKSKSIIRGGTLIFSSVRLSRRLHSAHWCSGSSSGSSRLAKTVM